MKNIKRGMIGVKALMRKTFMKENDGNGILNTSVAAGNVSGGNILKNRRLAMDGSVFVRRIWYDTIYARRHK